MGESHEGAGERNDREGLRSERRVSRKAARTKILGGSDHRVDGELIKEFRRGIRKYINQPTNQPSKRCRLKWGSEPSNVGEVTIQDH